MINFFLGSAFDPLDLITLKIIYPTITNIIKIIAIRVIFFCLPCVAFRVS